jgi:hypothetical protein
MNMKRARKYSSLKDTENVYSFLEDTAMLNGVGHLFHECGMGGLMLDMPTQSEVRNMFPLYKKDWWEPKTAVAR